MRITPRENHFVNEEWISDKSRFVWDGIRVQRLDTPLKKIDGNFVPTSWEDAISIASEKMRKRKYYICGWRLNKCRSSIRQLKIK